MMILQPQIGLKYEVKQTKKDNFVSNNNRIVKFDNSFQVNSGQCSIVYRDL